MILFQTSRRAICWQKSTREALVRQSPTWAAVLVAKPSETPKPSSSSVFTSQLWNGHEMRHWGWFLHYPLAFWFLKEIKIPFFPEERERRFADFITNLKQIEQKKNQKKNQGECFLPAQQGLLLKPANIWALKHLLLRSEEVSFRNMCEFIDSASLPKTEWEMKESSSSF